jgi:hypothetical protein
LEALEKGSPAKAGSSTLRPGSANSQIKRGRPNTPATEPPEAEISRLKKILGNQLKERRRVDTSISAKLTALKCELVQQKALDESIAAKMARLKELNADMPTIEDREPTQAVKMHFTLSNGKGGMVELDLDSGMVLTMELLKGLLADETENNNETAIANDEVDSAAEEDDTSVAKVDETNQPKLKKKKEREYLYKKQFNCWVPK